MGMTVKLEIVDQMINDDIFNKIFLYFEAVDRKFSTYKKNSEISKINSGEIKESNYSKKMQEVFALAKKTKVETNGYFDILTPNGTLDPSGIVKGWAIHQAVKILKKEGYKNFYIDIGGDIETCGNGEDGQPWSIGIRNPFKIEEVVKIIKSINKGIATSGNYVHKNHIYNPKENEAIDDIVSLTVVGPNIYEADRFATAAFAMGEKGIFFIENLPGFDGYMINRNGIATETSGFKKYII